MELILTKRGMDFREDEFKNLDLRNHRLRLRFEDRNGTIVSGDIVVGYKRVYSKKINKVKCVNHEKLSIDFQYEKDGMCYCYDNGIYSFIDENDLRFCKKDLLKLINNFSKNTYTSIKTIN